MAFCTISSRFPHFMHFQYIFPRVLPVSFSFQSFLHHFLWLLSHFPALSQYFSSMFTASSWFVPSSRSGFLHVPTDFAHFILVVITFSCQVVITCSFARFPLIVIMFSCSFYILFVGFQSIHAFLIYFSKIITRLLFAPFPLVCCIFNEFFQEFYPSSSFSDRFCTISSGCYRIFLHFHCLFPTCLLHRDSLFLAVTPVSSMFQQILHGLFLAFSSDRYHAFLKFHCIFQYILFVGFQYVLSRWSSDLSVLSHLGKTSHSPIKRMYSHPICCSPTHLLLSFGTMITPLLQPSSF